MYYAHQYALSKQKCFFSPHELAKFYLRVLGNPGGLKQRLIESHVCVDKFATSALKCFLSQASFILVDYRFKKLQSSVAVVNAQSSLTYLPITFHLVNKIVEAFLW